MADNEESVDEQRSRKKLKVEENGKHILDIHSSLHNLKDFSITRVLFENSKSKTIGLEGNFVGTSGTGILILEKKPFSEENVKNIIESNCSVKKEFSNDIYGNYDCYPKPEYNSLKSTIIYPATEKHIKKYLSSPHYLIEETPQTYEDITLPHILQEQFNLQWVFNILEHKSESERIVYEDPDPDQGFILLPDLKWNGVEVENLYLVAIVNRKGIKSLRDVTGEHLNLLKNIQKHGAKAIQDKYNISPSRLRVYIHYQPSFYHLHVHFTNLTYEAPGITTERAHLLSTVIGNITLVSDYYQKATLPFAVKESDTLFTKYLQKGYLK